MSTDGDSFLYSHIQEWDQVTSV